MSSGGDPNALRVRRGDGLGRLKTSAGENEFYPESADESSSIHDGIFGGMFDVKTWEYPRVDDLREHRIP